MIKNQWHDESLVECRNQNLSGATVEGFILGTDNGLRYKGKLVVPKFDNELKESILAKAHNYRFYIHPGGTKMYRDLKHTYWWQGIKRDVAQFVYRAKGSKSSIKDLRVNSNLS